MTTLTEPQSRVPAEPPEWFADNFAQFESLSRGDARNLPLHWEDRQPFVDDRAPRHGFDRHYVYHTAWAARVLACTQPVRHVDISSSLYFCSIASAFVPVDYYEYRPVDLTLDNLRTSVADLHQLPFDDQSVQSISCMHVVEHVGLGRYGDQIDPAGDLAAMRELRRVLAPGGSLLFVVPVGRPRIVFNAHRIYSAAMVRAGFDGLKLTEFALIPDGRHKQGLVYHAGDELVQAQQYGCGCFWFQRSAA